MYVIFAFLFPLLKKKLLKGNLFCCVYKVHISLKPSDCPSINSTLLIKTSPMTLDRYFFIYDQYVHTYEGIANKTHYDQFRWTTKRCKHCSSSEGFPGADGQNAFILWEWTSQTPRWCDTVGCKAETEGISQTVKHRKRERSTGHGTASAIILPMSNIYCELTRGDGNEYYCCPPWC